MRDDSRWPALTEAAVPIAGAVTGLDGAGFAADHLRDGSWFLALGDAAEALVIVASCWTVAGRDYLRRRHGSEETR